MKLNRRGLARQRIIAKAAIQVGDLPDVACMVVNVSSEGARLLLPSSAPAPVSFTLKVPAQGIECTAWLVWQNNDQVGVTFVDPNDSPEPTVAELEKRMKMLEAEVLMLKRTILEINRASTGTRRAV